MRIAAGNRSASSGAQAGGRAALRRWGCAALIAIVVIALDWVTKQAIRSSVRMGEERSFLPGVQLVHTRNNGVAFGLLGGAGIGLIVLLAIVIVAAVLYMARNAGRGLLWLPSGLVLGGALGNVIDRLRYGFVTDFIKLPLGWPPFNLADIAITLGVILLALMAASGGRDGAG